MNLVSGSSNAVEPCAKMKMLTTRNPCAFVPSRPGKGDVRSEEQQQIVVAGVESGDSSAWEMFYDDEGADEPVPWWFNSVTGQSTWECPAALMHTADPAEGDAGEQDELELVPVNGEPTVARGWTKLWSEEYQVQIVLHDTE